MDKYVILKLSKEGLKDSIANLSKIKPALQEQCLRINLDRQGKKDAKELGEHFDTAINAMVMVLGMMEDSEVKDE